MSALLSSYLKTAHQQLLISSSLSIYEQEAQVLSELLALWEGGHCPCSAKAERLRAFYCVEALHLKINQLCTFFGLPYANPVERSWAGLAQLHLELSTCASELDTLSSALRLMGRSALATTSDSWKFARLPLIQAAIGCLLEIVEGVSSSLDKEVPALDKVGSLFAAAINSFNQHRLFVTHAHNLVNITEENAISPWELKELQE
jgi:hypothetical protein